MFRYYFDEFLEYSVSLARLGTSFYLCGLYETSEIVLLFSSFIWVSPGRFRLAYAHEVTDIRKIKGN